MSDSWEYKETFDKQDNVVLDIVNIRTWFIASKKMRSVYHGATNLLQIKGDCVGSEQLEVLSLALVQTFIYSLPRFSS